MITGFKEIDKYIKHDRCNKIIALAGRPGMGRTSLAIDMIANYSEEKERVVYFSTKKYKWDILKRMYKSYSYRYEEDYDYRLRIEDEVFTIEEIVKECKNESFASLIIIDCFEDIESVSGYTTEKQKEIAIMRGLRKISDMRDCPILLLTKVDKKIEYQDYWNRHPRFEHINNTVSLYSDVVMTLYREDYYYDEDFEWDESRKKIEIVLAKNRGGYNEKIAFGWKDKGGINREVEPEAGGQIWI